MTITLIARMSSLLKAEAQTAANKIELDGYTVSADNKTITCDEDGCFCPILFFRNGEEVIAVPDFYISEELVSLIGSKGGEYTFNNETLTAGW